MCPVYTSPLCPVCGVNEARLVRLANSIPLLFWLLGCLAIQIWES